MVARSDIIDSIRGQRVVIPDLESLLSDWPQGESTEEGNVQQDNVVRLHTILGPGRRLKKMKAAKFGTLAATWWPDASREALQFAAYLVTWLFLWDDDTDTPEYTTELVDDMTAAQSFREETLAFVDRCLNCEIGSLVEKPSNRIINSFQAIGDFARYSFTDYQRLQLHHQLKSWINTTATEQWHEITGNLPSVQQYIKDRMCSSAVGACLVICEYMLEIDLPQIVRQDTDMQRLWDCTNIIISISNDMLSFKKEIGHSRLDNLIVLFYLRSGSWQSAMNGAFERVRQAKNELDKVGAGLVSKYSTSAHPELGHDVQKYVDCCKTMCTGNNTWSLRSERYRLGVDSLKGGIEIQL